MRRMALGWALLFVVAAAAPAVAASQHVRKSRAVVNEVVNKIHRHHIDGEKHSVTDYREAAIGGLRQYVSSPQFELLEDEKRHEFRKALLRLPQADLDGAYELVERYLEGIGGEEMWKITDAMVRGALAQTGDPFSQFLDQKMLMKLMKHITGGRRKAFGFAFQQRNGAWVIEQVLKGYDAYDKGLARGDLILEVDGKPVALFEPQEFIEKVKGSNRDRISLRIYRRGWTRPRTFELVSRVPTGENVEVRMLPGKIGYLRLGTFLTQAGSQVEKGLDQLEEQGARAIIFDVRDNPGGAVQSCVKICDKFLPKGKLIARIESRAAKGFLGMGGLPERFVAKEGPTHPHLPMIVLVNGGSASASEFFSGAMKDHGRALVLGTSTFGKGVGQSPVLINSAFMKRILFLTQMRYYNPGGKSPDKVGVQPHIVLEVDEQTPRQSEELLRLREEDAFARYIESVGDVKALLALAEDDEGSVETYPGFEEWRASCNTELDAEVLRRALRKEIRQWAKREKEVKFVVDLRDDTQLRRAIDIMRGHLEEGDALIPEQPKEVAKKRWF